MNPATSVTQHLSHSHIASNAQTAHLPTIAAPDNSGIGGYPAHPAYACTGR